MSYLGLPRLHLLGTFFTDPSTVNNDPTHYDPAVARPSPWQNPKGQHRFMFTDVRVNSAVDATGTLVSDDPVIGATANSLDTPSPAKLVDLDVYQQAVPEIYGFVLGISIDGGPPLVGRLDRSTCNGLWYSRVLPTRGWQDWDEYGASSFGGDTFSCGVWRTTLRVDPKTWPATTGVLSQLKDATTRDSAGNYLLAVRMVVDSFQNVPWHDDNGHGRVLMTLGPVAAGEQTTILGRHWLSPRAVDPTKSPWYWPSFYGVSAEFVQRPDGAKRLVLDFADALALQQPGGPVVPLGDLTVLIGKDLRDPMGPFQVTEDLYDNLGGIIELPVSDAQWARRAAPLQIVTPLPDIGGPLLWSEGPGPWIEATSRSFRLEGVKGATATSTLKVTQFGAPMANVPLKVAVVPVVRGILAATVPWEDTGNHGNTSSGNGALTATVTPTDAAGLATVTLTVQKNPGERTPQLDGQLYFIVPYVGPTPPDLTKVVPPQEAMISCVVFQAFPATRPTWKNVRTLMEPYAKLYPGMTEQIDLTQEQAFFTFAVNPPWIVLDPSAPPIVLKDGRKIAAGAIPYMMTRDVDDPRFMPVTRDFSKSKLDYVLNYVADLQSIVQPTPPPPHAPTEGGPS